MLQTIEAEVDINGNVHWPEPLQLTKPTRILVTLLPDKIEMENLDEESLEGIGASMKANSFSGHPPRFTREELHERR
ncbi:MAG TPA: hypothetical protein PLD20_27915 [Blastocatellia bacterium]|nr:hypothetical protein [Blastocatellia bacterium]HMV86019.1 hypothetical protein [Blastocatellia bacterium]HMX30486.1 hypothetical protein [Blastocatellia bacterium]HMY70593.1 hypothetical protein [Blastocatellia bacterium]HMZ21790.1 hypothetical protein [Blastocatellia bacterium]